MLKDRKIIITGALGLVGKELLKIFCKTNQKIYAIDLQGQLNRYADFIKDIKMRNKNIHFIDCDINSKKFYNLINEFYKITNVPVLLNTSFNLNGEPIVMSPSDAIRTFHTCGLDVLVLQDYVVEK